MSDNPLAEVHAALHLAWHAATYKDCRRYVETALVALRYIEQNGGVTAVTPLIRAQVLEEAVLKPAAPPPSDDSA